MIFPCPEDIRDYKRFPLTWTLVGLNVVIFMMFFMGGAKSFSTSRILDDEGLELTGRLYYQYLQSLPASDLYEKPSWVLGLKSVNMEHLGVLGAFALRDAQFLQTVDAFSFRGDEIKIAQWRKDFAEFRSQYEKQVLYQFGLSSLAKKPVAWLTYQFSHSNFLHLFSNLAFLILLGCAVEASVGSASLLFIYLFGGFTGGLGFLLSDAHGTVPMVGASASISALLAFYCLYETRKRIRFLYFISPMPGQYGAIYLPTLLIVPLFLIVDLANLWSTPEGLGGGVAYAAHLGGTLFGALAAAFFKTTTVTKSLSS